MVTPRPFDFFSSGLSHFVEHFELGLLFFSLVKLTADYWLTKSINSDHVTKKDFLLSSRSS